jgi:hypothetical protein
VHQAAKRPVHPQHPQSQRRNDREAVVDQGDSRQQIYTPVADAFLHSLATSDVFSPQRATVYTLGARLRTPLKQTSAGGVWLPDIELLRQFYHEPEFTDARHIVNDIRSQRGLKRTASDSIHQESTQPSDDPPALFRRRDWLWVRDGGSSEQAVKLWQQCSAQHTRFSQTTALWQRTHAELQALQKQFEGSDSDEAKLHYPWLLPTSRQTYRWHLNATVPEDLSFCLHAPDVITYVSPTTSHVPVFWYDTIQRQRAALAGANPPIAAGPPPFIKAYEDGVEVYHGFGQHMPRSMADLFIDPRTWDRINNWMQSYLVEIQRVEQGYKFCAKNIIGGRDGIDVSVNTMWPIYRRCVWHQGGHVQGVYHAGAPVPVESSLPDHFTQVQVFDVYRSAIEYNIADMEICSMIALYGVRSSTACSGTTVLMPNAQGAWANLKVLQDVRTSKLEDYGLFPRLSNTMKTLEYFPARILTKNVVEQERDDGTIKFRGTSDFGARRQRIAAAARQRRRNRTAEVLQSLSTEYNSMKSNAPPGIDSPNFCIPDTTLRSIMWGKASTFAQSIDILLASRLKVDVIIRDFKSWYEEWSRCASEVHLNGQICSSEGVNFDTQCVFGQSDCCHLLSRCNYVVLDIIQQELNVAQANFDFVGVSTDVRRQMLWYSSYRKAQGYSGRWTTVLPFVDDNTFACVSGDGQWTAAVIRIVEAVWQRFHFELSHDKSTTNVYDATEWSPVLGRILHTRDRSVLLTAAKVRRYSDDIDSIIDDARAHPKRLVAKKSCERVFGRLLFACEAGVPTIWRDFLSLISSVSRGWSHHWLHLTSTTEHLLRQAQWKLHNENGACFTSYTPRPMVDDCPIVVSYTDASRKLDTFEGGYGGWLWVHGAGSTEVFWFCGKWDPAHVELCDINELETLAAEYAADFADVVIDKLWRARSTADASNSAEGDRLTYLVQFGDSQVYFDHVAPGSTANSHGLRFLYRQRAMKDQGKQRLTITQHVLRGRNQPADSLSNGQVQKFKTEMQSLLGPGLTFTQLDVSLVTTSLTALVDWKLHCAQDKARS